jgi:RES domain-containing protein
MLDGEGNREEGARWNSPGRGVVYMSRNLSLCVLETFAHLPAALRLRSPRLSAVQVECPDVPGLTIGKDKWSAMAGESAAMRLTGDAWLAGNSALWLEAPSVIVSQETNVMLNPLHPAMAGVKVISIEEFAFDARLSGQ